MGDGPERPCARRMLRGCPACAVASPRSPPRSRSERRHGLPRDRRDSRQPPLRTRRSSPSWAPWRSPCCGPGWSSSCSTPRTSPARSHALRNRTFDAPALLPSVMVVWVFVLLVRGPDRAALALAGGRHRADRPAGRGERHQARAAQRPGRPQRLSSSWASRASCSTWSRSPGSSWAPSGWSPSSSSPGASAGWSPSCSRVCPAALPRRGVIALRVTRVLVALICLALLGLANNFNEKDNPWRAAFDSTGLRWRRLGPAGELPAQRLRRRAAVQHPRHRDGRAQGLLEGGRRGDRRALPRPRPRR